MCSEEYSICSSGGGTGLVPGRSRCDHVRYVVSLWSDQAPTQMKDGGSSGVSVQADNSLEDLGWIRAWVACSS